VKRALVLAVAATGVMLTVVTEPALAWPPPDSAPSAAAQAQIPPQYLTLYTKAAQTCSGLPWEILAAIGTIESGNGTSAASDVHGPAGAGSPEGPMQFEASTFDMYAVRADKQQALSPYDPADAIYTAAKMLCVNGAKGGSQTGINDAIYSYNHSWSYVDQVVSLAEKYAGPALHPSPVARLKPTAQPAATAAGVLGL